MLERYIVSFFFPDTVDTVVSRTRLKARAATAATPEPEEQSIAEQIRCFRRPQLTHRRFSRGLQCCPEEPVSWLTFDKFVGVYLYSGQVINLNLPWGTFNINNNNNSNFLVDQLPF